MSTRARPAAPWRGHRALGRTSSTDDDDQGPAPGAAVQVRTAALLCPGQPVVCRRPRSEGPIQPSTERGNDSGVNRSIAVRPSGSEVAPPGRDRCPSTGRVRRPERGVARPRWSGVHEGSSHVVLRDISLTVRPGEVRRPPAPAGAASPRCCTTAGLDSPTTGEVRIGGDPVVVILTRDVRSPSRSRVLPWRNARRERGPGAATLDRLRDGPRPGSLFCWASSA